MADLSGPLGSRRVPVGKGEVWRDAAKLVSVYVNNMFLRHYKGHRIEETNICHLAVTPISGMGYFLTWRGGTVG